MRILLILLVAALASGGCVAPFGPSRHVPRASGNQAVLFIGNSHTYTHDVPQMVETLARWMGNDSLETAAIAEPNFALEDHLALGVAEAALKKSSWRWVVMQQGTSALPESQLHLLFWAAAFEPFIRESGAEPVMYQIWPMSSRRFDADAALTSYWNAAAAVRGLLAPAGDAFTAAMELEPPLDPYSSDGLHANRYGAYLSAVVIFQRITGIEPSALPPRIPGASVDSNTVRKLQQAAATALARSPARPTENRTGIATIAEPERAATFRLVSGDTSFFPEGLAADPTDGSLFIAGIGAHDVLAVAPDGSARPLLQRNGTDLGPVLGVALDPSRQRLWLTTADLPHARRGAALAELVEVERATGRVRRRMSLGDGTGIPGELTVTARGDVLVSDGLRSRLYRLRAGAARLDVVQSAALRSPQGIATLAGDSVAYVADWSRGLLRWDLVTDAITSVPRADGALLRGVDGLRAWCGGLIAVHNGSRPNRVLFITLAADGHTIERVVPLDTPADAPGELTVGALAGERFVVVASSAWPFYADSGARLAERGPLPAVWLREIPLDCPSVRQ